jgi:hypothetical protein
MSTQPLSNMQLELLKRYANNVSEQDLSAIKRLLAKFFMQKAIREADKVWEEKGLKYSKNQKNQS